MKNIYKITAISIFFFFSYSIFAQQSRPHFVSLNVGTNIPLGDYKEIKNLELGSADDGISYSFEAGAYFSRFIGLGFNLGVFENSLSEDDLKEFIQKNPPININDPSNLDISSSNWVNGYFMLGPYLSLGTERFIIDLKVLAGVMNSSKPSTNFDLTSNANAFLQSREVSSTAIAFNYGIHLRIKLIGKLGLRVNAEGFQSAQEFETEVKEFDVNGLESQVSELIKKDITSLNLGAGLVLTF